MSATSHEDIQELLGAYALDAVDEGERHLVDEHLATCVRCRAEVNDHRETVAMLAFAGQPAPDGVWASIASELEEPPPPLDLTVRTAQPRRKWRSGGLLAAAAVVISVLALAVALRDDADPSVPDGPRLHLESADGIHSAEIVLAGDAGYVVNDNLPELPDDQVYQLWGQRGPDLISLGLLGTDPDTEQFVADEAYEGYAITIEKAGGVVSSVQDPVVAGRAR